MDKTEALRLASKKDVRSHVEIVRKVQLLMNERDTQMLSGAGRCRCETGFALQQNLSRCPAPARPARIFIKVLLPAPFLADHRPAPRRN